MNKQESDILNVILQYQYLNQRALAEQCGFSLGIVNRSVKSLHFREHLPVVRVAFDG